MTVTIHEARPAAAAPSARAEAWFRAIGLTQAQLDALMAGRRAARGPAS